MLALALIIARPLPHLAIVISTGFCGFMENIPDVLKGIVERKSKEVAEWKKQLAAHEDHPVTKSLTAALTPGTPRVRRLCRFYNAINKSKGSIAVIAEIKRKSPSKGHIGHIPYPGLLSRAYYEGGAAAVSVLTDKEGFGCGIADLKQVVDEQENYQHSHPGPCPILRKDFIIDPVQIAEATVCGASAVLLIVAVLGERTKDFIDHAHAMGLDALVEVHDEDELKTAIDAGAEIIGINNRNLHTFEVSLETSKKLQPLIPNGIVTVAESGIRDVADVRELCSVGFQAVLVGEFLVVASESTTTGYDRVKDIIKTLTLH